MRAHAGRLGHAQQIAHAHVLAPGVDVLLAHRGRRATQPREHRMETV